MYWLYFGKAIITTDKKNNETSMQNLTKKVIMSILNGLEQEESLFIINNNYIINFVVGLNYDLLVYSKLT